MPRAAASRMPTATQRSSSSATCERAVHNHVSGCVTHCTGHWALRLQPGQSPSVPIGPAGSHFGAPSSRTAARLVRAPGLLCMLQRAGVALRLCAGCRHCLRLCMHCLRPCADGCLRHEGPHPNGLTCPKGCACWQRAGCLTALLLAPGRGGAPFCFAGPGVLATFPALCCCPRTTDTNIKRRWTSETQARQKCAWPPAGERFLGPATMGPIPGTAAGTTAPASLVACVSVVLVQLGADAGCVAHCKGLGGVLPRPTTKPLSRAPLTSLQGTPPLPGSVQSSTG